MRGWQRLCVGALLTVIPGAAFAEEGTYPIPTSDVATSESSWDVPGALVIDGQDNLSDSDLQQLFAEIREFSPDAQLFDTDFDADTRIKVASVAPSLTSRLAAKLRGDSRLEHVEPLSWVKAEFVPNDPRYKDQWHMKRVGSETAWDYSTGRGVTVAVVDTGIACENYKGFTKGTDLAESKCVGGWNLIWNHEHANDDQGHGTHVAGTIAQSTDNALGVTGLSFNARLMPVKVLDKRGWGTTVDVANGIRWAADNGAHVINLSLGGPRNSDVMQAAVDHARSQGVVIVASAGNSGGSVGYPGGSEGVIGVSASDSNDKLAGFSSRGKGVDIGAPGVGVVQQTICNGGQDKCEVFPAYNGTSMASPHVAGAAAMLISLGITDADAVEQKLTHTARQVDPSAAGKVAFGAGILDAGAAAKSVVLEQGLLRSLLVGILAAVALLGVRRGSGKKGLSVGGFAAGALWMGPGLFFLPLLLSRAGLPIEIVSRPFGELSMLVGASLHRLLPLAHVGIPLALFAIGWHSRILRGFAAGAAVGTGAFLLSLLLLGQSYAPFGGLLFAIWCVGNAAASVGLARFSASE